MRETYPSAENSKRMQDGSVLCCCAVVLVLLPWALATLPEVALTMSTFVRLAVRDDRERSFEPALLCGRNFREDSLEASHSGVKSRIPVVRTRRDKTAMPHGQ